MMIKDMNKFDYKQKIKFTNDNFSCTTMDTLHLLLLSFSKHKSSRVHWVFPFWHFHFPLSKLSCHSLSLDNCASPSFPEVELIFLFFLLQLCTKKRKEILDDKRNRHKSLAGEHTDGQVQKGYICVFIHWHLDPFCFHPLIYIYTPDFNLKNN